MRSHRAHRRSRTRMEVLEAVEEVVVIQEEEVVEYGEVVGDILGLVRAVGII